MASAARTFQHFADELERKLYDYENRLALQTLSFSTLQVSMLKILV